MSIERRTTESGQNRWVVRWRDPLGRPGQKTFRRHEDAKTYDAKITHDKALGLYRDPKLDRVTMAAWHESWWPTIADGNLAPGTVATYESLFRLHILPEFGSMALVSLRKIDVERWLLAEQKAGLSGPTIAKIKSLMGRLLTAAVDDGIITSNPVLSIRIAGTSQSTERTALTPAEVQRLIDAVPAHYRTLTTVLADCGLRPSEALGLRRRHVDLGRRRLLIDSALVESHGQIQERTTKTARTRQVPLTRRAVQAIEALLAERPADDDARVFVTPGGTDVRLSNYRRVMRAAVKEAGLDPSITPYNLRHTCASLIARSGVPAATAAKALGHDPRVFLKTYAHVYDDDLDMVAAALEKGMSGETLGRGEQESAP